MTVPATSPYSARPANPLRIGLWTRFWDAYDARRNAAASPPRPNAEDDHPSTPRLEAIDHHHRDAIQGEWLTFLRDTRADRVTLARLEQELADARITRAETMERRSGIASASVPVMARPGEESLSAEAVARRRQAAHRKRLAAVDNLVTAATKAADARAAEVAEARQRIRERLAAAQTRAQRIHERDAARIDRYRAVLCRRHPDGIRLNTVFCGSGLNLPTWVTLSPNDVTDGTLPWAA